MPWTAHRRTGRRQTTEVKAAEAEWQELMKVPHREAIAPKPKVLWVISLTSPVTAQHSPALTVKMECHSQGFLGILSQNPQRLLEEKLATWVMWDESSSKVELHFPSDTS